MNSFQVTFSNQAMSEINKMSPEEQLNIIENLSNITPEQLKNPRDLLGLFSRDQVEYYRLRSGEFRIYFENMDNTLHCHYILHQHSLSDFIFRFKFPVSEEQMIENHSSFWKYLESLKK